MRLSPEQSTFRYQVGGSLPPESQMYVQRSADRDLFEALQAGEFCYVLNARQMGKSSLRVRTMERLTAAGVLCGAIDLSAMGTHNVSMEQWYAAIAGFLAKRFRLSTSVAAWWRSHQHLSAVNCLYEFIESVLLVEVQQSIVIFIDEIDTVLSLKFPTDDFFALIRFCFNQRASDPVYQRLTFALFGVATPSELIADKSRTPFNLGQAIALQGFQWEEADPLLPGLAAACTDPEAALRRIFEWTGGQPFLTQKLCQLVVQSADTGNSEQRPQNPPIAAWIDHLVHTHVLQNWETQDEPEHLKTIRDRLLFNEQRTSRLLALYERILLRSPLDTTVEGQVTPGIESNADDLVRPVDSRDQSELLLSGLVEKYGDGLRVKNPIYQTIFSLDWVSQQLRMLRPYESSLQAWVTSGYQDESRLLRGQTLREVLEWSKDKSLGDLDYRFLAASQECDRREVQARLETERLTEVEARLKLERQQSEEQQRRLNAQRLFSIGLAIALLGALASAGLAYNQYQRTAVSELKAIVLSSEALFASRKPFEALLQAIKAHKNLLKLPSQTQADLQASTDAVLWRALLSVQQSNRLTGHKAAVLAVDYSVDGQQIATAGVDGTINLWGRDGRLIRTIEASDALIRTVKFSPDGTLLASGGDDRTIKLWRLDGTLVTAFKTVESGLWNLDFSPDSTMLVSAGPDSVIKLWSRDGTLIKAFPSKPVGLRVVKFSPDGQTIAAGNVDTTVELWSIDGTLQRTLNGHQATVQAIAFHPNGQTLVSGSADGTINVWSIDGKLLRSVEGHEAAVWDLDFAPDGQQFASASWDSTVKLWLPSGQLADTLYGHDASVWSVAYSPDSQTLVSAGADNIALLWQRQSQFQRAIHGVTGVTIKLLFAESGSTIIATGSDKTIKIWNFDGTLRQSFEAHEAAASNMALSPDGQILASVSEDTTLKLWNLDGTLRQAFGSYGAALMAVSWHPNGTLIAASAANGSIGIWSRDGDLLQVLNGHTAPIWDVEFSPRGDRVASGSNDTTVKLWTPDGDLIKTLEGHQAAVWQVTFSPTGDLLASGSGDTTVKLWTPTGELIKTLEGHQAAVWGIAFSPDGSLIATSSIDETIKLWTHDGTLITTLNGHESGIRSVAFHPNQPILISSGDDQTIMVWQLDQILNLEPVSYACEWVGPYLTTNSALSEEERELCD